MKNPFSNKEIVLCMMKFLRKQSSINLWTNRLGRKYGYHFPPKSEKFLIHSKKIGKAWFSHCCTLGFVESLVNFRID